MVEENERVVDRSILINSFLSSQVAAPVDELGTLLVAVRSSAVAEEHLYVTAEQGA